MKSKWKLSRKYCDSFDTPTMEKYCQQEYLSMLRELRERKRIMILESNWELQEKDCLNMMSGRNRTFCLSKAAKQKAACEHPHLQGNRLIIDLENQVLYGIKDCRPVLYSRTITGKNSTPTPTGHYRVYERRGAHYMQNEWFVNMALYFRGGYAVHDAGWRVSPYWTPSKRGVNGSHGCINTPHSAMETVWNEFSVGDAVDIYRKLPDEIKNPLSAMTKSKKMTDPENP